MTLAVLTTSHQTRHNLGDCRARVSNQVLNKWAELSELAISLSAPPSLWKRSIAWSQQLGHIFRWLPAACCTRSLLVYSCFKAGFWRERSCTFENSFRSALLLFSNFAPFFETRPPISLKIWRSRAFIVFGNVFCRSAAIFYFDVLVLSCLLVKDWPDSVLSKSFSD